MGRLKFELGSLLFKPKTLRTGPYLLLISIHGLLHMLQMSDEITPGLISQAHAELTIAGVYLETSALHRLAFARSVAREPKAVCSFCVYQIVRTQVAPHTYSSSNVSRRIVLFKKIHHILLSAQFIFRERTTDCILRGGDTRVVL